MTRSVLSISSLLILLSCLVSGAGPASPDSVSVTGFRTPADSVALLDQLRDRVRLDRHDYQARIRLSDLLSGSRDVELRREAWKALHEAMLIDGSDPEVWIRMARLQETRGFRREARNAYQKALSMDPDRSDLWSELAQHELRRFQRYQRAEFFSRALWANKRSLSCDSDNADALRRAVRIAYISADHAAVDSFCARWESAAPESGWPDMVRGLIFAENKAWDRAWESFERGLAKFPEPLRKPFVRLNVVNPIQEDQRREAAPDTMRFFQDYWRWRDPTPADDVNERLVEHYRRMVQAELLFSLDHLGVPGWEHDPGEMIIRYGLPADWTYHRNVIRGGDKRLMASSPVGGTTIRINYGQAPPPMFFTFVDYNLTGRYITPMEPVPMDVDFFMVANPSLYEALFNMPQLDQEAELWRFVDRNGEGRIELAVALPPDWWPEQLLEQPHRLSTQLTLYDDTWAVSDGMVGSWAVFEKDNLGRLIGIFELEGSADSVVVGMETEDRRKTAHAGGWVTLPPLEMEPDTPILSDLAFLSQVAFERAEGQYGRGYGSGLPNPGHRYRIGDPVGIAFEAYHLGVDSDGSFKARLRISVGRQTRTGFFNVLLGRAGAPEAELAFDVSEPGSRLDQLLSIDIPPLDPGDYVLKVTVEDLVDGKILENSGLFRVLEEGKTR